MQAGRGGVLPIGLPLGPSGGYAAVPFGGPLAFAGDEDGFMSVANLVAEPLEDGSKATWAYVLGPAVKGHTAVELGDLGTAPLELVKALATQGPVAAEREKLRTTDIATRPLSSGFWMILDDFSRC